MARIDLRGGGSGAFDSGVDLMMMQWFINEVREKFQGLEKKIQEILDRPVLNNDERITKLEGEIKAMKARMGKQKDA